MNESKRVFDLCLSDVDESVELGVFLDAHPDVDVNLFQDSDASRQSITLSLMIM
jgi:hypothetical protein